jgi:hypothetical protein
MSDEPKTIPMPFVPGWFDDLPISILAFRVASRIYRRGNQAFDSITKMEREFKVSNRTMAGALKELLDLKLITEEKRTGLTSIYRPSALQHHPLVLTSTTTQCSTTPPPSALQHHKGTPSKANHSKAIHSKVLGSNSAPHGTALSTGAANSRIPSLEESLELVESIHTAARRDPNEALGMFPPEEVAGWVKQWHLEMEATGGNYKGSAIKNPVAALKGYLRSTAANQSKRLKINRHAKEDTPSPF